MCKKPCAYGAKGAGRRVDFAAGESPPTFDGVIGPHPARVECPGTDVAERTVLNRPELEEFLASDLNRRRYGLLSRLLGRR